MCSKNSLFFYFSRIASFVLIFIIFIFLGNKVYAMDSPSLFVPTIRDTQKDAMPSFAWEKTVPESYELLYETESTKFFFRADRNIFAYQDLRNDYIWKTGIDIPFNTEIDDVFFSLSEEEKKSLHLIKEERLNTLYTGVANSLLVVEYYDDTNSLKTVSSASLTGVETTLTKENAAGSEWLYTVYFPALDLRIPLHISFFNNKVSYKIVNSEIEGKGSARLGSISISPFMGASGGSWQYYNPETDMFDISVPKPLIPGYIFVPDGSGALIRFKDNIMKFSEYYGYVYGEDPAQENYYYKNKTNLVSRFDPALPVFGIAHGDIAAFTSWASKGDEYMQIVVRPSGNMTKYTYGYPKFIFNKQYFQVYNKRGEGYFKILDKPNPVDIEISYEFLSNTKLNGEDSDYLPNYVGMAKVYRDYLVENKMLPEKKQELPSLCLDFIVSDIKKNILGNEQVVMTTLNDLEYIFDDLRATGIESWISNISGWQKGGITGSKPWKATSFTKIGKLPDIVSFIENEAQKGIVVSLSENFYDINKIKMPLIGNAVVHANSWYTVLRHDAVLPATVPALETSYARPAKSAEWLKSFSKKLPQNLTLTIDGISSNLTSSYEQDVFTSRSDSRALLEESIALVAEDKPLFMYKPNQFLLKYTSAYLNAPVFSSSYLIETDTVPFLQMVLQNNLNLYAPYANFSFYSKEDILRMIDYNVFPSFVLTQNPSYLLSYTNSSENYATEYSKHRQIIQDIVSQTKPIFDLLFGYSWIEREVLQNGIIKNTYKKDGATKIVIINYTDTDFSYNGIVIDAESALCINGEN